MKKFLLPTIMGVLFPFLLHSQAPQTDVVSIVSLKKDTLFLAHNALGCEILDVWAHYPIDRPIIILKPEEWIINETIIRNKKNKIENENIKRK